MKNYKRNNNLVEFHDVPLNIKASSEYDTFFVNLHDTNHGYYFLTPNMSGSVDERMSGVHEWPLFMFETTDGGKSWNQISTNTFNGTKYIEVLKFVSSQVGILSFRLVGDEALYERVYITVDGGVTWNKISQLPHNEIMKGHSEVIDLEYVNDCDCYCLTIEAHNSGSELQIQFCSKDLINWSLIEY